MAKHGMLTKTLTMVRGNYYQGIVGHVSTPKFSHKLSEEIVVILDRSIVAVDLCVQRPSKLNSGRWTVWTMHVKVIQNGKEWASGIAIDPAQQLSVHHVGALAQDIPVSLAGEPGKFLPIQGAQHGVFRRMEIVVKVKAPPNHEALMSNAPCSNG